MSAPGYIKGQITRAANVLKEKIVETEATVAEILNYEHQAGNYGDKRTATKFAKRLLEAQVGLSHWMNNLTNAWKRGEEHVKQLEKEETRYQVLQEFTDHWEKSSAEKNMFDAQLLTQSTEYLKQVVEESLSNDTKPTRAQSKASAEFEVQLPRLEIPHFQGDMVEFPEFWELYKLAVHENPTLGAPAKFLHLKSVLKGTAKDLMASMTLSAENYPKAIELLLNTYNRPDVLRNRLVEQLEALPPSGKAVTEQRITLCKIKAIWVQLANLAEQPGSTMTMRTVRSKFPKKTREKVGEKRRKGDNWTTEDLIDAFDEVIDQLEIIEDTNPTPTTKSRSHTVNNSRSPIRPKKSAPGKARRGSSIESSTGHLPRRTMKGKDKSLNSKDARCSFCLQAKHRTADCDEVTSPYERREAVVHHRLCWKCLKQGHKSLDCDAPVCYKCGRNHHKSLCLQRRSSFSPRRSSSPRNRYLRRNSSADSYSSEVSRRDSSRSKSRSPSPDNRGRSPTRRTRTYRKGSPHPKVGFRKSPRTYAYSNSSPTPTSDHSETKHTAYSELDSYSDDSEEETFRVNTVSSKFITSHALSKKHKPSGDKVIKMLNPPRLMVVQALTINKTTKSKQLITVLLDSGSQHSYIRKDTARNLGLKLKNPQNITALTFGGHLHTERSYRVKIELQNQKSGLPTKLYLWTRKVITSVEVSNTDDNLGKHHKRSKTKEKEVDILIGMDYYWDVVDFSSSRQLPSGLVESETTLGPVLSGCQSSTSSAVHTASETDLQQEDQTRETDRIVQHLFGLESLETKDEVDESNESIIKHYYNTKGQPFSNLIFAKAKLAEMKKTSIPRLELVGSVLAAKLVRFLRKQLNIPLNSVQILSDSQIALYWIHSNKQLKTFVSNRVKYIKEVTKELTDAKIPYKFHYVNTDSNPADCATRGLSASELKDHMWWHGPQFILDSPKKWPNTSMDFSAKATPPKEAQEEFKSTITTSLEIYKSFIPFTRTNSYKKLVRVTSYVLKYVANLWRKSRKTNQGEDTRIRIINLMSEELTLTTSDIKAAEVLLLREHYREGASELQSRIVQRLRISLCEDGTYRGDLRMANAEITDSAKNPILLLPKHHLTKLIVTDLHEKLFHAGASHLISELRRSFNSSNQLRTLESHEDINNSYVLLQDTLNTFWNQWQKEYLQTLAERNQKRTPLKKGAKDTPKIGDVVLVKTENISRSQWPLGLIVQINDSVDGSIRSVRIKTGNNKFLDRSINQLIPLEVCASEERSVLQSKKQNQPTRIQPDRRAKRR
ncbi:zinc knuckle, partial [Ostertagia ostertagi]